MLSVISCTVPNQYVIRFLASYEIQREKRFTMRKLHRWQTTQSLRTLRIFFMHRKYFLSLQIDLSSLTSRDAKRRASLTRAALSPSPSTNGFARPWLGRAQPRRVTSQNSANARDFTWLTMKRVFHEAVRKRYRIARARSSWRARFLTSEVSKSDWLIIGFVPRTEFFVSFLVSLSYLEITAVCQRLLNEIFDNHIFPFEIPRNAVNSSRGSLISFDNLREKPSLRIATVLLLIPSPLFNPWRHSLQSLQANFRLVLT